MAPSRSVTLDHAPPGIAYERLIRAHARATPHRQHQVAVRRHPERQLGLALDVSNHVDSRPVLTCSFWHVRRRVDA